MHKRRIPPSQYLGDLCVSETWLLPHTPDSYIHIGDYSVYRCDKNSGGGITTNADRPNGVEDV